MSTQDRSATNWRGDQYGGLLIAKAVNGEPGDQLRALETIAGEVTPAMLGYTMALQTLLEQRLIFQFCSIVASSPAGLMALASPFAGVRFWQT